MIVLKKDVLSVFDKVLNNFGDISDAERFYLRDFRHDFFDTYIKDEYENHNDFRKHYENLAIAAISDRVDDDRKTFIRKNFIVALGNSINNIISK